MKELLVDLLMIGSQTVEDFRRNPYFFVGDGTEETHLKELSIILILPRSRRPELRLNGYENQ